MEMEMLDMYMLSIIPAILMEDLEKNGNQFMVMIQS